MHAETLPALRLRRHASSCSKPLDEFGKLFFAAELPCSRTAWKSFLEMSMPSVSMKILDGLIEKRQMIELVHSRSARKWLTIPSDLQAQRHGPLISAPASRGEAKARRAHISRRPVQAGFSERSTPLLKIQAKARSAEVEAPTGFGAPVALRL